MFVFLMPDFLGDLYLSALLSDILKVKERRSGTFSTSVLR
jgi:hypothetical protein